MNLIDELGGYGKAKEYSAWADSVRWHDINQTKLDALHRELLEYRREHGIYEVGDKVVWKESLTMDKCLMEIIDKNGDTWGIRHATDKEIAAGHRINKTELEDLELIDVSPCCKKIGDCDE